MPPYAALVLTVTDKTLLSYSCASLHRIRPRRHVSA